jgi:hypothetical protein
MAPKHPPSIPSWRERLPIHPAAELFPPLSHEELLALGEDIKNNGLQTPIAVGCERVGETCLTSYSTAAADWTRSSLPASTRSPPAEVEVVPVVARTGWIASSRRGGRSN